MNSLFDIFKIDKADRKNCPQVQYLDSKETLKLMDWNLFEKKHFNINNFGYATVVLGYWRNFRDDRPSYFEKAFVLSTRGKGPLMIIQHFDDRKYDLLLFYTPEDMDGNPIQNEEDRIKGCLKLEGYFMEEHNNSFFTQKLYNQVANDLSVQYMKNLKIFAMLKYLKKKQAKKKKKNSTADKSAD